MYSLTDFKDLLSSDSIEVKTLALKAMKYKEEFDAGTLNKTDYDDLMDDLTNLEKIDQNLFSVDVWAKFMQAVKVISVLRTLTIL